jgi:hypothetical protein
MMNYMGMGGRTGTIAPQFMNLSQLLSTYGTTNRSAIQPVAPTQRTVSYPGGLISKATGDYLSAMNQMTTGKTFDFTAQPMTWMNIQNREVSARAAADESLGFNEANLGRYSAIAQELTRADTATRTAMLDQFVPDWRQKRDAAAAINESLMRGEIPKDVADQLKRNAAYAGVMGGGGAGVQRSLTARDLGTTSLELQKTGMAGAQSWTQMMAALMPEQTTAAGIMTTQGMTPQMALETSLQNAANQLQTDITNVQGRLEAAYKTQDIGLRAATGKTAAEQGWAGIRAQGLGTALETYTGNLTNAYAAQMNAAATEFANAMYPYQSYREGLGLTSGQRQRTGFGL